MAYEKYTWVDGEVITAQKLNHMEDGIGEANEVFVVHINYDEGTDTYSTEESWDDIKNAVDSLVPIMAVYGCRLLLYDYASYSESDEVEFVMFSDTHTSIAYEGTIDIHRTYVSVGGASIGVHYRHDVDAVAVTV